MGRFKTSEERQRKKMEKKPMSLGNLAKPEDLVVTDVDKEAKTVTVGPVIYTPEEQALIDKGVKEEKQRILALVFGNKEVKTAEFKVLVKHTGSYLAGSMAIAYSRGFNDVLKLILTGEEKDEKPN